jgi:hypothetical protein
MSGAPSWAVRGQKVVCVATDDWINQHGRLSVLPRPRFGEIGTISSVTEYEDSGLWFIGLVEYAGEIMFAVERFRPAVEDEVEATLFRRKHYGADAPLVPA